MSRFVDRTYIYALREPGSKLVSYVGATNNLQRRAHLRLRQTKYARTAAERWLASLAARGLVPELDVLEIWPEPRDARFAERWLLWNLIVAGHPIQNQVRWDTCWVDDMSNLVTGPHVHQRATPTPARRDARAFSEDRTL